MKDLANDDSSADGSPAGGAPVDGKPDDGFLGLDPEESWELEVGHLLGGLPMVEPPDGFIGAALDRRPLYAGRTSVVFAVAGFLAGAIMIGSGLLEDETFLPDVEVMVSQHSVATAGLLPGIGGDDDHVFRLLDDAQTMTDSPVGLPAGFRLGANFALEDLHQIVFESEGNTVSVFEEPGRVDFGRMRTSGMADVDGISAWLDPQREMVIFQTSDSVVTVIGLRPDQLEDMAKTGAEDDEQSRWKALCQGANRFSRQLGFPDVG